MPVINTTWEDAKDPFKVVGVWKGEAVVKKLGYVPESKGSQKPAWKLDFTLDNGDDNDGVFIRMNGSYQPQALFGTKETFVGCGCDPDLLAGKIDTDLVAKEIVGNRVILSIEPEDFHSERTGKTEKRNKVVNVEPA